MGVVNRADLTISFDGLAFRKILEDCPDPVNSLTVFELLANNRDTVVAALDRGLAGKTMHRAFVEAGCDVSYSHFMTALRRLRDCEERAGRGLTIPCSKQSQRNKRSRSRHAARIESRRVPGDRVEAAADSLTEDI